ncbi:MAG: FtsB family cell division protein [Endomicrobiales bacterium]
MKIPRRTAYIIGGAVLCLFLFGNSGFRKMLQRYWEIHRLNTDLERLKKENVLLRKESYYLEEDSSYIERIARRELGLIAPGEVEYRFKK